jgi:hypothetical protein
MTRVQHDKPALQRRPASSTSWAVQLTLCLWMSECHRSLLQTPVTRPRLQLSTLQSTCAELHLLLEPARA